MTKEGTPSYYQLSSNLYVLNTYGTQLYDGLRQVFQRVAVHATNQLVASAVSQKKVLVCDMPLVHIKKLSPDNINICYTTFETTQLPSSWVEALNTYYHHCIVPHLSVKNTFISSGVSIPILVIQQGYARRNRVLPIDKAPFRVGFLGVPQLRKNLNLLFEACQLLKSRIPELRLAVHAAKLYSEIDLNRLQHIQASTWVDWTTGEWSEHQIAEWYSQLSSYVFPSSGEGWSFTPRESLFMSVPTIVSDIPVHRELIQSGFCTIIPHQGLIPAQHEHIEDGKSKYITYGNWYKITSENIAHAILTVYQQFEIEIQKAQKGSAWIANKWDNQQHYQDLLQLMNRI